MAKAKQNSKAAGWRSHLTETACGAPAEEILERVELYICGVELANGYSELTDPKELKTRFNTAPPDAHAGTAVDADLVRALEAGMPESAGMALGLDRLLMLLLDAPTRSDVLPFHFADLTAPTH